MSGTIILSLLGAAATAPALTAAPIELWNGFTTASTKAQIKAFMSGKPRGRVEVYTGCAAKLLYRHSGGRLVTIIFLGQDGEADCFARMNADLHRDHGEPETADTTFGSVIGYGRQGSFIDTTSDGTVLIWREGEKKTKLVRTPGNGYNLIFTVRPDKYIY